MSQERHHSSPQPFAQGGEALMQWEAWNEMVADHLEKQHNPTMHAIRQSTVVSGGGHVLPGGGPSRSNSFSGDKGHALSGFESNELAPPHFFAPTTSSFRKLQRESLSTPKSRADLFRSAHSPTRANSFIDLNVSGGTTHSAERKRVRSFVPPSALESSPDVNVSPTDAGRFTGNYLIASAPFPHQLIGKRAADVTDPVPIADGVEGSGRMDAGVITIEQSNSGPGSATSGTPRSARIDPHRLQRLRQERQGRFRTGQSPSGCSPLGSGDAPVEETHSPTRAPTLEDIARGTFDDAMMPANTHPTDGGSQTAAPTLDAEGAPLAPEGDEPSLTPVPVDMPVLVVTPPAPPAATHQAEESILSSPDSTSGKQSAVGEPFFDDDDEGSARSSSTSSSADVAPVSSADEAVAAAHHYNIGGDSAGVTAPGSNQSRKRATVEQMPFRKKKELMEKVRSRQQQQHHGGTTGADPLSQDHSLERGNVRSDSGTANASQHSNADADVSKDDERARVHRQVREKKSAGRRKNTVVPPDHQCAAPRNPDRRELLVSSGPACNLEPQDVPTNDPIDEPFDVCLQATSPRRSVDQVPRPRRKSFVEESSATTATSADDLEDSEEAACNDDEDVRMVEQQVHSAQEQPNSDPLCVPDHPEHHTATLGARSADAAADSMDPPIGVVGARVGVNDDSEDDLDAVVQSVIRERSVVAAMESDELLDTQATSTQLVDERLLEEQNRVVELENQLHSIQLQLDSALQELKSGEDQVKRMEHQQSSLLCALGRCVVAAEMAEEEDEARREILLSEQYHWDHGIVFAFHEVQLCLEVERYEQMADERATSSASAWSSAQVQLRARIETLESQLRDAFEQHEKDISEREEAFNEERVELARAHMDALEECDQNHAFDVSRLERMHSERYEEMCSELRQALATAVEMHDSTLQSTIAAHTAATTSAEQHQRWVLSNAQSHGVSLADMLWLTVDQQQTQIASQAMFSKWKSLAVASINERRIATIALAHDQTVRDIAELHERQLACAADEYSKLSLFHEATAAHCEELQTSLDTTRDSLASLQMSHKELQQQLAQLTDDFTEVSTEKESLRVRVNMLEALVCKAEDHILAQRKELCSQESAIFAQKLVQERTDRKVFRLSAQRSEMVVGTSDLRGCAYLRQWWNIWHNAANRKLLLRGKLAVRQNDEARQELQSWREYLASANSPRSKFRVSPAASSRTASHLSIASTSHTGLTSLAVGEDARNDVCDVLPGEDDMCVSLKYLLARERADVAAVKSSLVKHRKMLAEGNTAMERMLLEMEILSKQNKELVGLCHKKHIDVPRALQSGEVPRLVQRLMMEDNSSEITAIEASPIVSASAELNVPSASRTHSRPPQQDARPLTYSREGGGGYVVD